MNPLSEPCGRHSRRTGQPCRMLVVGGGPCRMHGGAAPQVRAKREQRIALAEAARRGRQNPVETLADIHDVTNELRRRAMAEADADGLTPETLGQVLDALERAGRWAKTLVDVGFQERETRVNEMQGQYIAATIGRVLDRLSLTAEQRALVPVVVPEELRRQGRLAIEGGAA